MLAKIVSSVGIKKYLFDDFEVLMPGQKKSADILQAMLVEKHAIIEMTGVSLRVVVGLAK